MKIAIDKIRPSPDQVRKTWDEDKMSELAQSIKERGLIVPIKVRTNGKDDKYELIYGHRRTEACKRIGWTEIEATVEREEDIAVELVELANDLKVTNKEAWRVHNLIDQLIENIMRENEPAIERAEGLRLLKQQTGWNNMDLERRGIIKHEAASQLLLMLDEDPEIQEKVNYDIAGARRKSRGSTPTLTPTHIKMTRPVLPDKEKRKKVLEKAGKENLTAKQTRVVAEAVSNAKDSAEEKALLESSYYNIKTSSAYIRGLAEWHRKKTIHDNMLRQEKNREVADYLDQIKRFQWNVERAIMVADWGKFSPEAARFTKRKHDELREKLLELEEKLGRLL